MTITRKATGVIENNGSASTVVAPALNVAVGDLIVLVVMDGTTGGATAADTAGNTFSAVTGGSNVNDGNMFLSVLYTVATAANASDVITATKNFGQVAMAYAQYSTTGTGWSFETLFSIIPAFGTSVLATSPFNLSAAGLAVAGCFNDYEQICTFTATNSLTSRAYEAGTAALQAKMLQDEIYTSSQTGLVAGVTASVGDRSALVGATFLEVGAGGGSGVATAWLRA